MRALVPAPFCFLVGVVGGIVERGGWDFATEGTEGRGGRREEKPKMAA